MRRWIDVGFAWAAALMFAVLACGCGDDTDAGATERYMNFATFEGNESGSVRFTLRIINDSPLITLTCGGTLDPSDVSVGDRVLLTYELPVGMTVNDSGRVSRLVVGKVTNMPVVAAGEGGVPPGDGLGVQVLYRTGHYINMQFQAPYYKDEARKLRVVAGAVGQDGLADLYVVYERQSKNPTFDRTGYASANISDIWDAEGCRGVRVHVNNSLDASKNEFVFLKSDN